MSIASRVASIVGLADKIGIGSKRFQDGYTNTVTGVGTSQDKSTFGSYVSMGDIPDFELEILFAENDLAHTVVARPVEDALRDGFSIQRAGYSADEDAELQRKIMARYTELQAGEQRTMRAAIWGRLFGGGALLIGAKGAGPLVSPLDDEKIKALEFLKDIDKQQLQPYSYEADGSVKTFLWTPVVIGQAGVAATPIEIHKSRFIFFPGAMTTALRRQPRQGWDLSVLQKVYAALLSFDGMWKNVDAMFSDASQAVFHIQGLISSLGENTGIDDVNTRLRIMNMFRSASNAVVLDAGDDTGAGKEDFKVVDRASLGGLDSVMQNYMVRLAAAARMPLTVLLGMSPAGMDATGESDMALYFGSVVDVYRKQVLAERILRIVRILAREQGEVEEDYDWEICWPELEKPKPIDVSTTENMRVQSMSTLTEMGAILPEEAAMALEKAAPGLGLRLDLQSRRKSLKVGLKEKSTGEQHKIPEEPAPGSAPKPKAGERKSPAKSSGGATQG